LAPVGDITKVGNVEPVTLLASAWCMQCLP